MSAPDGSGWKVAVVGGTGGLGRALARFLAGRGAHVLAVGRTFRDPDVAGLSFLQADLESLRAAERAADALAAETLDLLVFTTGIFAAPKREQTAEGIERDLAISYLNRFVVLRRVAERLGTGRAPGRTRPRVVVMGYPGNGQLGTPDDLNAERSYGAFAQHMNTVAGNEALVLDGVARYPHLDLVGLNPGLVKTEIRSNFLGAGSLRYRVSEWLIGLFNPTPDQYAERIGPLLVGPGLDTGAMFDQKGRKIPASPGLTADRVAELMRASEALAGRVLAPPA